MLNTTFGPDKGDALQLGTEGTLIPCPSPEPETVSHRRDQTESSTDTFLRSLRTSRDRHRGRPNVSTVRTPEVVSVLPHQYSGTKVRHYSKTFDKGRDVRDSDYEVGRVSQTLDRK